MSTSLLADTKDSRYPLAGSALDPLHEGRLMVTLKKSVLYKWPGHAVQGLREGRERKTLYLRLDCEDNEKNALAKSSWDVKEEWAMFCLAVWNEHNKTFRNLLQIPMEADCIISPSGAYNPLYSSMTIFPNTKYTKFYDGDQEPPKVVKWQKMVQEEEEEEESSFDFAIEGNLKTIHYTVIRPSDLAMEGDEKNEKKEGKYQVLALAFFNVKKCLRARSEESKKEGQEKRHQKTAELMMEDLRSKRKRKAIPQPESMATDVNEMYTKKTKISC